MPIPERFRLYGILDGHIVIYSYIANKLLKQHN